jgi:hypothetical protein
MASIPVNATLNLAYYISGYITYTSGADRLTDLVVFGCYAPILPTQPCVLACIVHYIVCSKTVRGCMISSAEYASLPPLGVLVGRIHFSAVISRQPYSPSRRLPLTMTACAALL